MNEAATIVICGSNLFLFKRKYDRYSALLRKNVAVYTLPTSQKGAHISGHKGMSAKFDVLLLLLLPQTYALFSHTEPLP